MAESLKPAIPNILCQAGLRGHLNMNTSGPLAFQTTFNRPLHQIFASWPGQDSSHGRNQLNAAHTTWGNQHSASVYPAPQLSIPYPHQQHQHQHMPWSNDQHMLQSAAMTPDISVQHQPQQPRDYQGWARDPNALSSKASDASGYCRQQQFPGGGIPHVTGHPQQQMPTLGAAQSTIPQRSEPAKRLRLSPVQEYPGGTRILARPANAWPGLPQQTEGILHTGKACYQPAPHALQPAHSGAKRPSPNWTASDAHSRTLPASNVHQHQQHVHASDFQSTHLAQAAAARHQSAIRRTSGAHTGGNPAPMNGVRPGLLAELASDLGVSSPSSPVLQNVAPLFRTDPRRNWYRRESRPFINLAVSTAGLPLISSRHVCTVPQTMHHGMREVRQDLRAFRPSKSHHHLRGLKLQSQSIRLAGMISSSCSSRGRIT